MPFFSILIAFRDRDTNTLDKCLAAIAKQSFQDFEVLFLDYGSRQDVHQQARIVCEPYDFLHYFHTETVGQVWNKSKCLNYLIKKSKGTYLFILDADIFVSPAFLELAYQEIQRLSSPNLLELRVWQTLPNNLRVQLRTGRGICLLKQNFVIEKGGYDTFFRQWGVEDDEMIARLTAGTKESIVFIPEKAPLIHIWHPHDYTKMPKGWLRLSQEHFAEKKQAGFLPAQNFFPDSDSLLAYQDRPVLLKMASQDKKEVENFVFKQPTAHSYTQFLYKFATLSAGKFLCVEQCFEYYVDERQTFTKKIIRLLNIFLKKIKISYRFTDIGTHEKGYLALLEVRDFLFYFLLHFETQILDYFFEYDEKCLTFWVCKKTD